MPLFLIACNRGLKELIDTKDPILVEAGIDPFYGVGLRIRIRIRISLFRNKKRSDFIISIII